MPQTRSILVPRVLALMTDHEPEGSGVENEPSGPQIFCTFRGKMATEILINLWSETIIQFALENSKTSRETREVYSTLQATDTPNKFPMTIVRYSAVDVDLPQVDLQNQGLLKMTFRKSTVDAR